MTAAFDDRSELATRYVTITQLSCGSSEIRWAIVVFAYNEARTIQRALASIVASAGTKDIAIYVVANGCTDTTAERVRDSAAKINNLWLVETDFPDKASAWNLFVHDVLTSERAEAIDACFFMDGDVTLLPPTLPLLASALEQVPSAEAAGAMPATGRDRNAWRERMVINSMLAGNCYALRGSFVQALRRRPVRMPVGLIGEDFFVSWLVASDAWREVAPNVAGARCVFHSEAEFAFRSLSPWRPRDYRTYMRRKWRYALRGIQHQMLVLLLEQQGLAVMPRDVNELYLVAALPSRLVWSGLDTPLRFYILQKIRAQRARS